VPYIVGVNSNSPKNPHSALASGGFDVGKIVTDPAEEAYVLNGAVVGGLDRRGRFYDTRSDWPQTEV
jgi:endoglucanase